MDYANDVVALVALDGVVGVGEWEVDENGNGKAQLWEWK